MDRPVPLLLAFSFAAMAALGALPAVAGAPAPAFGSTGEPRFVPYPLPSDLANADDAAEPTIGIPWDTDHVFFQAYASTHRAAFTDGTGTSGGNDGGAANGTGRDDGVTWTDVTPSFTVANVDPMLHADYVSGRIFAGGLAGPCSLMGISDDDGETWTPAGNMCSGAQFDHQSIGSGPWSSTSPDSVAREAVYPRATYYCAQLARTACATSVDGGRAWLPFTEVLGACGGLHGHIEVSEVTGMAAVPHGGCSGGEAANEIVGFAYTTDNGATWDSRVMPQAIDGDGFDPDLVFSHGSGWLWLAQADHLGIHIALSKDEGITWEELGNGTAGAEPAAWFSLNPTFRDPRTGEALVYGAFPDLVAGDDERVALAFLGTTNPDGDEPFGDCGPASDGNIWHYYLATSYDAGATWNTTRLSEDPVQVGAIWNSGGGAACRNLLDFNDMDMDSKGRLHIAFADGCIGACAEQYAEYARGNGDPPTGSDSRDAHGTILRQQTGRGMFAAYDVADVPPPQPEPAPGPDGKDSPGVPVLVASAALALLAAARRR